jgi:hypothetical protein
LTYERILLEIPNIPKHCILKLLSHYLICPSSTSIADNLLKIIKVKKLIEEFRAIALSKYIISEAIS